MSIMAPLKIEQSGLTYTVDFKNSKSLSVSQTLPVTASLYDLVARRLNDVSAMLYNSDKTFNFDGSSARIAATGNLFNRSSNQELTIMCFAKPCRLGGQYQIIAENRAYDGSNLNWILYQHVSDGSVQLHGTAQNKSSYIPITNVWSHFSVTVNSGLTSSLYVNGTLQQTVNAYAYAGTGPGYFTIGGDGNGGECFSGSIDLVSIYNRALSGSEINQYYQGKKSRFGL